MKVKSFLRSIRENYLQALCICERAKRIKDICMSANGKSHEPFVIELLEEHKRLMEKIKCFLDESRKAEKLISTLDNANHRCVLQLYYLCGYSWSEIAEKTNYTLRWVHKLHKAAIEELERRSKE